MRSAAGAQALAQNQVGRGAQAEARWLQGRLGHSPPVCYRGRMIGRAIKPALAYWAGIFALGFVLGTIRVLWGAAAVGETGFVLLEVAAMLLASWLAARWLVRRFALRGAGERLVMGAIAFALLIAAEMVLASALSGMSPSGWLASLGRPPGLYGLLGQIGFGLMPWFARRG